MDCVFCTIIAGRAPAGFVPTNFRGVVAFVPLGPVVDGHVLFVPRRHVVDAAENPLQTALTFQAAAEHAQARGGPFNLITSAGREATQSVFHLHIHYVPRAVNDGLMTPWGTLHGENPQDPHRCKGMVALEQQLAEACTG